MRVKHRRLRYVLEFIQANHADAKLSLCVAAARVRLSTYHLSRWLKQETGAGFSQHLRAARVAHACELLDSTQLSVKEIACAVGYNNTNALARNFKVERCLTPNEYRCRIDDEYVKAGRIDYDGDRYGAVAPSNG